MAVKAFRSDRPFFTPQPQKFFDKGLGGEGVKAHGRHPARLGAGFASVWKFQSIGPFCPVQPPPSRKGLDMSAAKT